MSVMKLTKEQVAANRRNADTHYYAKERAKRKRHEARKRKYNRREMQYATD
jgi:hypothetical protein